MEARNFNGDLRFTVGNLLKTLKLQKTIANFQKMGKRNLKGKTCGQIR